MSKTRFSLLALCLGLTFASVGCSNPKEVSKDNFGKAIAKSLKEHGENLSEHGLGNKQTCFQQLGSGDSPIKATVYPARTGQDYDARPGTYSYGDQLDALAKSGLLTSQTIKEEENPRNGKMVTKEYTLTDQGKSKIQITKSGKVRYLPFCKIGLKAVASYIEPSDDGGGRGKYTQVKYAYVIEDLDGWAKDPANQDIFPDIKPVKELIGKPIEASMTLVLTSEGWENPEDSRDRF
jgi:hypothetical protein